MSDSNHERLVSEVHQVLDGLTKQGRPWIPSWIVNAICQQHSTALRDGDHQWFWIYNGHSNVRQVVRKVIGERAGDTKVKEQPRQIEMPGFERIHLNDYYIVRRKGEDIGVPITDMTDEEIEGKAALYRSMGKTCYNHADELDRFRKWRRLAELPAAAE